MLFEKDYHIDVTIDEVLGFITDTDLAASCVPNLEHYEKLSENEWRFHVRPKFSFLQTRITMDWKVLAITRDGGALHILGKGMASTFEADVTLALKKNTENTALPAAASAPAAAPSTSAAQLPARNPPAPATPDPATALPSASIPQRGVDCHLRVEISVGGLLKQVPQSVVIAGAGVIADELMQKVEEKCRQEPQAAQAQGTPSSQPSQ